MLYRINEPHKNLSTLFLNFYSLDYYYEKADFFIIFKNMCGDIIIFYAAFYHYLKACYNIAAANLNLITFFHHIYHTGYVLETISI